MTRAPRPLAPGAEASVVIHGRRFPNTRSGEAALVPLTDEDALALIPGELLLVETPRGASYVEVVGVRFGQAGELGALEEVPVVDVVTATGKPLAYAPGDLLTPLYHVAVPEALTPGNGPPGAASGPP